MKEVSNSILKCQYLLPVRNYVLKLFTHDENVWCEPKNGQDLLQFILEYMNKTLKVIA